MKNVHNFLEYKRSKKHVEEYVAMIEIMEEAAERLAPYHGYHPARMCFDNLRKHSKTLTVQLGNKLEVLKTKGLE